jgi:hypothetical protein
MALAQSEPKIVYRIAPPDVQALFCRRRHRPRRPPLAKIRPQHKSVLTLGGAGLSFLMKLSTPGRLGLEGSARSPPIVSGRSPG